MFGVMWIALGVYWGRRAKSLEGFMVAGRNVGLALGTATAVATWITSNTTMLAPQFALQLGIWGMLAYSTASFGLFLFAPLAKRIRQAMPHGYTSVEFIRLRYGPTAYVVFLVISLFYGLTWMVSMGMAGGILLEALAGIPYAYGMSVILFVCVVYTLFGGLYAVIGTDFIQSLIILVGVVVVAIAILARVPLAEVYGNLQTNRPALLNVFFPAAIMAVFNNLLFGIGEIFHSNVWWSRAFAMREGVGIKAYLLAGMIWLPIPIVAGFLGLAAPTLGINITRPDVVGPLVAANILGYAGGVLVFIVVFCSLASSIDSLLAATSDVVTKEVVQPLLMPNATDAQIRKVATVVIILVGLVTWAVCLPKVGTLATVLFFAGPLVGSTIWPIIAGLFWRRVNATGAVLAMVLGSSIGLFAYFQIGWYTASLIGTAVSFLTLVGTTLLRPRAFDWGALTAEKEVQRA
jgi:Na+/proline symporter